MLCSRPNLALLGLLDCRRACLLAEDRGRRRVGGLPVGDEGRRGAQGLLLRRLQRALPGRVGRFTSAVLSSASALACGSGVGKIGRTETQ